MLDEDIVPSRRHVLLGLAGTAIAAGCGPLGATPPPTPSWPLVLPTATASPVAGKLLLVHGGNFYAFDLGTLKEAALTHLPSTAFAASPVLSPDRKRLAYSFFVMPANANDAGGSDLYVMDVDGQNVRLVRSHPVPEASYAEPSWTPDGKAVVVTYRMPFPAGGNTNGLQPVALVRISLEGNATTTLVDGGQTPAVSPDGKHLAYLTVNQTGVATGIWVGDADGKGARDVLSGRGFSMVRGLSFSPTGDFLAFAAVGGPVVTPTPARARVGVPGMAIAEAHGIPWDIWTIRPDGTDLRQLTHVGEDGPVPTWAPDGAWIAIAGEIGVYVVDGAGTRMVKLSTIVSGGGIVWLEETR